MQFRNLLVILSGVILFNCAPESADEKEKTTSERDNPVENRIDSLLSLMTIKEKIGQLNQYSVGEELTGPGEKTGKNKIRLQQLHNGEVGSVLNLLGADNTRQLQEQVLEKSRLKIPVLFAYDVIHGYKTLFPVPLGESASWDMDYIKQAAAVAADESSAAGLHWTFAPMVDVGRDPRWGRVMEGAGEDSYLGSEIARARVSGLQGDDLSAYNTIAACAKHFAGYGFVEGGKDYNNVNVGMSTLMNIIIPPFKAAEEAGAATFMNAFNDIDGVPSTANDFLLQDLLKEQWGFEGFVVSDWNSIGEMVAHGTVADKAEAAMMAINAGTDMDMEADAYNTALSQLVEDGKVDIKAIDEAVRRVLRIKYRLGLFDDPFKYHDAAREKETLLKDEHL
ncbi:MAG: glycoside hydrolase family 3 N-terminal domain-containing protein, partial [Cyclobacteriaceae bacterium]